MRSCKKCRYSKPVRQLGIVDWYCTNKEDWIGFSADALFCRKYATGMSDEEIEKIVDEIVKKYYKKGKVK